jgi:hypothetical protein
VSKEDREVIADWLMVAGGVALFASLFLTWSHQFSRDFLGRLDRFGAADLLRDVPRDPTAWQVYSVADVVLALLAIGLLAVALFGTRPIRIGALAVSALGLAFIVHAISVPPTDAPSLFSPSLNIQNYFPYGATAGAGETIALIALLMATAGLVLSFSAD